MFCKRITYLLFFMLTTISLPAQGQEIEESDKTEYRNKILFLPALGSSPETGFIFGAVVVPQFKFDNKDVETRSSSILFSGIYTT